MDSKWRYISLVNRPIARTRFNGVMQGLTLIDDEIHFVEVKIGAIEFDISLKQGTISGDSMIFEDVSATIFPEGQYSVEIE